MKPLALAAALTIFSLPGVAGAHGVEAEIARSGVEITVRARYHGGRALAGARYEVVSPAHPERAHDAGRTDRHGWLAFEADAPGTWRIRIADASGHGRVVEVEVTPGELAAVAPRPSTAGPLSGRAHGERGETSETARLQGHGDSGEAGSRAAPSSAIAPSPDARAEGAGPLRVALGALGILLLFGAVFAVRQRRAGGR